jgi:tetratricopeptide (TPR) repeat protein
VEVSGDPPVTRRPLAIALGGALFASALALFWPVRQHAWLNYDDTVYLTGNPELHRGLSPDGIAWAFSTFYGANWFPVTWLSWLLDFELYGLDAAGFLTTNALLHALNVAVLFAALVRLTGSLPRSAFVAAVFAAHPLHVESVAWVSARKDVLSGLFFLLAIWIYGRPGAGGPAPGGRAALLACLALGLMAKPVVVALPFALLLLDLWPLGRLHGRRPWLEKLPMFALVAAFSVVAVSAQSAGGSVVPLDRLPLDARLGNAVTSYAGYLTAFFWPTELAVFYPHTGDAPSPGRFLPAAGLLAAVSAAAWRLRSRCPALGVGWLWFLLTLFPAIGLVQVGSQSMADRYMYLPLVGPALAIAWALPDLLPRRRAVAVGLTVTGVAVVASLALATRAQLGHWRSSASLMEHALAVTRDNHVAHTYLAVARLEEGRTEEALAGLREAVRLRPDFLTAVNNLAWLLATLPDAAHRNPYLAVRLGERAATLTGRTDPMVLDTLAAAYAAASRFDEAERTAALALARAEELGDTAFAARLRGRIALYREGRPYLETGR